jgi:outer membrane lipoprotein SlyB
MLNQSSVEMASVIQHNPHFFEKLSKFIMSEISNAATGAISAKTLWAAIGALGVAVVGLGGALYYVQSQPSPETKAPIAQTATATPAPKPVAKPATVQAKPAAAPVALVKSKPVCMDCATVAEVSAIEREGETKGAGAVAGGVLGAVVGNQFGKGQGKDLATILGAVGGGFAGNQVEKKMNKQTVYQVRLRMDDGSIQSLEQAQPISVGTRVRLQGNSLLPLQ